MKIKELIKRAKKWRNDQWPDHLPNTGRPKSYLMAVLVISACSHYTEELGCILYDDMVERVDMDTLARRYIPAHINASSMYTILIF